MVQHDNRLKVLPSNAKETIQFLKKSIGGLGTDYHSTNLGSIEVTWLQLRDHKHMIQI